MKQISTKVLIIFLMIFVIGCARNFSHVLIDNGQKLIKVNVEIVNDEQERNAGLMFRQSVDENSGMLFVFDDEMQRTFWMKNTLIPLDIIFIGKDSRIVDIKNALPCRQDACALYKSSNPAKYVLEVNAGFAASNDIKIGNKIILNQ